MKIPLGQDEWESYFNDLHLLGHDQAGQLRAEHYWAAWTREAERLYVICRSPFATYYDQQAFADAKVKAALWAAEARKGGGK